MSGEKASNIRVNASKLGAAQASIVRGNEQLQMLNNKITALSAQATEYSNKFHGVVFPTLPQAAATGSDIDLIRAQQRIMRQEIDAYQQGMKAALLKFHSARIIADASESVRAAATKKRAFVGPSVASGASLLQSGFESWKNNSRLGAELDQRRKMAESAFQALANAGVTAAASTTTALQSVFAAKDKSPADLALKQLEAAIARQLEVVKSVPVSQKKQDLPPHLKSAIAAIDSQRKGNADEGLAADRAQATEMKNMVGTQVENVLSSMGYTVSGISETMFVKDGAMYAYKESSPEHVLRLKVDDDCGTLVATPLRINSTGSKAVASSEVTRKSDMAFDKQWCSGVREFEKQAKVRGVELRFNSTESGPEAAFQSVQVAALGGKVQARLKATAATTNAVIKPRARKGP